MDRLDKIKPESKGTHRGKMVGVWLNDEAYEKLNVLTESTGKSKSDVLRDLLMGKRVRDRSFWKLHSLLASIGGLLKKSLDVQDPRAYQMGKEIVKLAHELRDGRFGEAEAGMRRILK